MTSGTDLQDRMDDYTDTIFAIVGFVNFYRFDDETRQMRDDVMVFQGRRLTPSPAKATTAKGDKIDYVTPDLGVVHGQARGVLGEAKHSFPRDRQFWIDDFRQLMAYDDDLTGWPCLGGRVEQHDVVLLTHLTNVVAVCDYYQQKHSQGEVTFARPFAIVSFGRVERRQPSFHFEKRLGSISDKGLDERLRQGVPVLMSVLQDAYSTVKLYDAKPPLPYMAQLIWEHVATPRASEHPRFPSLRKNQRLEVPLTIEQIADELHKGFSFRTLAPDRTEREPQVPRKKWCVEACEALVGGAAAKWAEPDSKEAVTVYFRKVDSVLEYMLEVCAGKVEAEQPQLPLFAGDDSTDRG